MAADPVVRLRRTGSLLRRRARSPLARRVARSRGGAFLLAAIVACVVGTVVADAESARARWGSTGLVAVALEDLEAGSELGPDVVALRHHPEGLLPDGAVREVPEGRRLAMSVTRGEVILSSRLARLGAGSTAALLPEGSAAITVPLGSAPAPLSLDDLVDVLAPAGAVPTWEDGVTVDVVARGARVIALRDGHATLVIDRAEVERTAAAVLEGTLTVALTG
jgi:Flp pilus assembly protein CpaB